MSSGERPAQLHSSDSKVISTGFEKVNSQKTSGRLAYSMDQSMSDRSVYRVVLVERYGVTIARLTKQNKP